MKSNGILPVNQLFGYSQAEYRRFRRYAWRYLVSFSLLYCTLYCSRLSLANTSAALMQNLGFTKADIGILTGTLFWTYGIGQLINGRISDVTSPGKLIVLSAVLSVLCNIIITSQSTLSPMAAIWGLNGLAQSMAWAPGIAVITRWWPGSMRGFATGFALAFSGFGQVLAMWSVFYALEKLPRWGWRSAFYVSAAIPMLMLAIYLLFAKTSPEMVGLHEYVEDRKSREREEKVLEENTSRDTMFAFKYILRNSCFRTWMLIIFLVGLTRHGLSTWVPLYFIDAYGVDITTGLIQSLSLPVGMGIGTIIVPWLTDKYCPDNRLLAVTLSAFIAVVIVILFVFLNPLVTWQMVIIQICLFLAGFCIYAISGTSGAYATDVGGRVLPGTATGLLSFSAYMGAAIQSLVYGFALDKVGWGLIFISIAFFCALIGVLALINTEE